MLPNTTTANVAYVKKDKPAHKIMPRCNRVMPIATLKKKPTANLDLEAK